MSLLRKIFVASVLAGFAAAQPVNLTGRGFQATVGGVTAGTGCASSMSCAVTLTAPPALAVRLDLHGKRNGLYVIFIGAGAVCTPNIPPLGMLLLGGATTFASGVMSQAGTATGCPGRATLTFPRVPGVYFLQSVQQTPGGLNGWTTPIKLVL